MQKFKNFTGMVAPLDRANVDTDQIIPKQFLKAVVADRAQGRVCSSTGGAIRTAARTRISC